MKIHRLDRPPALSFLVCKLALGALLLPVQANPATGTWVALTHDANDAIGHMHLLSDGTVMAQRSRSKVWYRLTPDATGGYRNGTWSPLAPMNNSRLYYSSQVLRDGSVFVAGGEYSAVGDGTAGDGTAEIFQPLLDAPLGRWITLAVPATLLDPTQPSATYPGSPTTVAQPQGFTDSISEILANGSVLVAPVKPKNLRDTLIYNPDPAFAANPWSAGPPLKSIKFPYWQAEASWVKLPDDSVLTIDPDSNNTERYIPASNTWVTDADVLGTDGQPLSLYYALPGLVGELGPAFLLPDGRALFLGGSGKTAFYTPEPTNTRSTDATHTKAGTWAQGPDLPFIPVADRDTFGFPKINGDGTVKFQTNPDGTLKYVAGSAGDAPGAMMPNGKILFCRTQGTRRREPVFVV